MINTVIFEEVHIRKSIIYHTFFPNKFYLLNLHLPMHCNFMHLRFVLEDLYISSGSVIPLPCTNPISIIPIIIRRYCWIKKTMISNQIPILLFNNIYILIYNYPTKTTMKRISCNVVSFFICHVFNQEYIFIQYIHQLFD